MRHLNQDEKELVTKLIDAYDACADICNTFEKNEVLREVWDETRVELKGKDYSEGEKIVKTIEKLAEKISANENKIQEKNNQITLGVFKDEVLNKLAFDRNVAQFISLSPNKKIRYNRVLGYTPNYKFLSVEDAIDILLYKSCSNAVSIRSFNPNSPQSNPFIYRLTHLDKVVSEINKLAEKGLYTIINECIDVNDGGVNGVCYGGCIEFAPNTTPRFVENSGELPVATLSLKMATSILAIVYKTILPITQGSSLDKRIEFSVHPQPRGYRNDHVVFWEEEKVKQVKIKPHIVWPNSFSTFIGDKAYGLLIAYLIGAKVPETTVYLYDNDNNNNIKPFTFGIKTGIMNKWTRTCPRIQEPGKFSTLRTQVDPFELMQKEDPDRKYLSSCLIQDEIKAVYSGAAITEKDGNLRVEGVEGFGDDFMVGRKQLTEIPSQIVDRIVAVGQDLAKQLNNDIRFEWVYDGKEVWIVQLHTGKTNSIGRVIVDGNPSDWISFDISLGLEKLRETIGNLPENIGIEIIGNIGMSSHVADVLRKANIPSRIGKRK